MLWQHRLLDRMAELLRFTLKTCLFIDLFMLALLSVWFTVKFTWFLLNWLDRVLFSGAW